MKKRCLWVGLGILALLAFSLAACSLLGVGGDAVSFSASGAGYGEVPYAAAQSFSGAVTVEAWVKLASYTGWSSILTKGADQGGEYSLRQDDLGTGHLRFSINDSDTGTWGMVDSASVLSLNTWHHVAGTYDGTTMNVYIDGVLDGTAAVALPVVTNTQPVYIGVDIPGATEYLDGAVCEARIWNVVRTADQIKAAMNTRLTGTETGLVLLCPLNDGFGPQFKERVSGKSGTLSGSYAWGVTGPSSLK